MNFNAPPNHAKIRGPYLRILCLKVQTYFHGPMSSLTNSSGDQIPFSRVILHRIVEKYKGLLEWDCHNAPDLTEHQSQKTCLFAIKGKNLSWHRSVHFNYFKMPLNSTLNCVFSVEILKKDIMLDIVPSNHL